MSAAPHCANPSSLGCWPCRPTRAAAPLPLGTCTPDPPTGGREAAAGQPGHPGLARCCPALCLTARLRTPFAHPSPFGPFGPLAPPSPTCTAIAPLRLLCPSPLIPLARQLARALRVRTTLMLRWRAAREWPASSALLRVVVVLSRVHCTLYSFVTFTSNSSSEGARAVQAGRQGGRLARPRRSPRSACRDKRQPCARTL